jgi:hypothetical protein
VLEEEQLRLDIDPGPIRSLLFALSRTSSWLVSGRPPDSLRRMAAISSSLDIVLEPPTTSMMPAAASYSL